MSVVSLDWDVVVMMPATKQPWLHVRIDHIDDWGLHPRRLRPTLILKVTPPSETPQETN